MSDDNSKAIGLIAGNRRLPFQFVDWAKRGGRDVRVAGMIGEVDAGLKGEVPANRYREFYVTEISKVIAYFKSHGIDEVVMIGGIAKAKLKLNFDVVRIAARLLFMKNKHKGLFTVVMSMFDRSGVKVRAIQDLMPELLIGEGSLGRVKPSKEDINSFKKNIGTILDFTRTGDGQAVIIYKGEILAFENIKGTDDLVSRATARRKELGGERGGIMAKIMEPGQDARVDLPVVGTGTVEVLAKYGIDGVIVEAGRTIADDVADTIKAADELGVFVYGIRLDLP